VNTANYRKRINEKVDALMGAAMDGILSGDPEVLPANLQSPKASDKAAMTARGILRRTLRRHSLTLDAAAQRILEGMNSERLRLLGEEVRSLPDTGNRLRSTAMLLTLLERAGIVPGAKEAEAPQEIAIYITQFNGAGPRDVLLAPAKVLDAVAPSRKLTKSLPSCGSSAAEARISAQQPYELPSSVDVAERAGEPDSEQ
jgi:hypothetical protein